MSVRSLTTTPNGKQTIGLRQMTTPLSKKKLEDEFQRLQGIDHVCAISKGKEEKFEILTSFLLTGLSNKEKTICIVDKELQNRILNEVSKIESLKDDVNTYLEFIIEEEIFHQNSDFDPDRVIQLINYIIEKTPRDTSDCFNIVTDYTWIFKRKFGTQRFDNYESLLNDVILNECKALCLYEENSSNSSTLLNAILVHSKLILKGQLCSNILFESSSLLDNNSETKLSRDLYESITQHLIKNEENYVNIALIKEKAQEEITKNKEKSKNLYRDLFENTGTAMVFIEEDMTISLINSKCEELFGYNRKDIEGKFKWTDFIAQEDLTRLLEYRNNRINNLGSVPIEYEARIITKSGEIRTVELNISTNDETNLSIASLKDITDKKFSEKELIESEEKFKTLFEDTPIGLSRTTPAGEILACNSAFIELFGYDSFDDIKDVNVVDLYPSAEERKKLIKSKNSEGFYKAKRLQMRKKDKSLFWVEMESKSFYTDKGEVTHYASSIIDVTNQHLALETIRENEKQYRSIVDTVSESIYEANREGIISYQNPKSLDFYGYSPEELIGYKAWKISEPEKVEELKSNWKEIFESGESFENVESTVIHKNGSKVFIESTGIPIYNDQQEIILYRIFERNITERKQAEDLRRESEEKYRSLINEMTEGFSYREIVFDDDGNPVDSIYLEVNNKYEELTGRKREDVLGKRYSENYPIFNTKQGANWLQEMAEVAQSGESKRFVRYVDDLNRWFDVSMFSIEKGKLATIFENITERVKSQNKLEESESKYRNFVENYDGIAFRGTMDFKPIYFHGAVEEITGYKEVDFTKGDLTWDMLILEEDMHIPMSISEDIKNDPFYSGTIEYRIKRKDGEIRWIRQRLQNLPEELNGIRLVQGSLHDFTNQKLAAENLRKSEEDYRTLIETSPNAILMVDLEGSIIFANQQTAELLGFKNADKLLETENSSYGFRYFAEESQRSLRENLDLTYEKGIVKDKEYIMIRADGTKFYAEVTTTLLRNEDGKPYAVMAIGRDTTERKKIAIALSKSEEKFRSIVETSSNCIWEADLEGKITYISPRVFDQLGYKPEEIIGKKLYDFAFDSEESERVKGIWEDIVKAKKPFKFIETSSIHKSGKTVIIDSSGIPIIDNQGEIIGFRGFDQDITERKKTAQKLVESEEKYRSLVESVSVLICKLDTDGTTLFVNPIIQELTGYTEEEIIGNNWWEVLYPGDLKVQVENLYGEFRKNEVNNYEMTLKTKKGELKTISWNSFNERDENGSVIEINGAGIDITDRISSDKALRASEKKFRELFHNANDGIFLKELNLNGKGNEKFIEVNDIACKRLGYTREELLNLSSWEIDDPEYGESHESIRRRLIEEGQATFERIRITKNGDRIPVEINAMILNLEETEMVLSISRDISERKENERILKEREEFIRSIIDKSPLGYAVDDDKGLAIVNEALTEMLGYSFEEIRDNKFLSFTPEEYKDLTLEVGNKIMNQEEELVFFEKEYVRKDGSRIPVRVGTWGIFDDEGNMHTYVGTFEDITERKKIEEERRITEQELNLLKHSLDSSLSAIVISDMNRNITYVNDAMLKLWGYDFPGELIGKNGMEIIPYSYAKEEDFIASREAMEKYGYWSGDVNAIKRDGTPFWTRMYANFVYNSENVPVAMMLSFIDISEQKEVEEALRVSEEKSRRIVENSPIGIMTTTPDGKVISANKTACLIFGYDSEESFISSVNTVGVEKKLYANPNERNEIVQLISETENWFIDENQFLRKDGSVITLSLRSHTILDTDGNEVIEAFFEDITDKKRIESEKEVAVKALVASEEELRLLNEELEIKVKQRTSQMETLYNLIRDVSLTFNLKEAMEVIAKYLGNLIDYDLIAQVISQEGLNHIHVEGPSVDPTLFESYIDKIKEDFALLNPEVLDNRDSISITKNEKELFNEIQTSISIPLIAEDKIVGFISVGSSNIDAYSEDEIWFLYRIADNISHTLQRLKIILTAKEELETVLNHTSDGIILLNSNRQIVLSNEVGEEFLGNLNLKQGDIIENTPIHLDQLIEKRKQEITIYEKIYLSELAEIKTDFVHGWLLTIREVTEEREMQKKIVQQERLAIIGQLTGGIAHDFNNMLASIIGAADFALMNSSDNIESQELLNLIIRQSERGASLVRQMLDFTRQTVVSPKPIDIQEFLLEFSRVVRASLPTSIALNASNTNSTIFMDQVQLQQLLMNLIINSRDAMPKGGEISLIVEEVDYSKVSDFEQIEIEKDKKYVHFVVQDDGEGMDNQTLKKAFEPFFTTKAPGKGSGLGLAQVYGITRQSQGYLDIKSEVGTGTEIHLFIPIYEGIITDDIIEEAIPGLGRILLVEDDEDVREITKIMLENYGYDVVAAENGKIALELYNDSFDLVLTDIIMPIMGGEELIKELQEINPDVRCMAMTGYADVDVPHGVTIVHKPMTSSKLVNHVQKELESTKKNGKNSQENLPKKKKENN